MTYPPPDHPADCRICAHVDAWIADRNLTLRHPTTPRAERRPPAVSRLTGSPESANPLRHRG